MTPIQNWRENDPGGNWEVTEVECFSLYRRVTEARWLAHGSSRSGRAFLHPNAMGATKAVAEALNDLHKTLADAGLGTTEIPKGSIEVILWDSHLPPPLGGQATMDPFCSHSEKGPAQVLLPIHQPGLEGERLIDFLRCAAVHEAFHGYLTVWHDERMNRHPTQEPVWLKFEELAAVALEYLVNGPNSRAWLGFASHWRGSLGISHNRFWNLAGLETNVLLNYNPKNPNAPADIPSALFDEELYGHFPFFVWLSEQLNPGGKPSSNWLAAICNKAREAFESRPAQQNDPGYAAIFWKEHSPWGFLEEFLKNTSLGSLAAAFEGYIVDNFFPEEDSILAILKEYFGSPPPTDLGDDENEVCETTLWELSAHAFSLTLKAGEVVTYLVESIDLSKLQVRVFQYPVDREEEREEVTVNRVSNSLRSLKIHLESKDDGETSFLILICQPNRRPEKKRIKATLFPDS